MPGVLGTRREALDVSQGDHKASPGDPDTPRVEMWSHVWQECS